MTNGPNIVVEKDKIIKDVYFGNQIIAQIYNGADLVFSHYPPQGIVFEKNIAGTYTFTPDVDGIYEFDIIGAGGGGAWSSYGDTSYVYYTNCSGGGGGYVHGYITLERGNSYTFVVGSGGTKAAGNYDQQAGSGTASTGFGQTANGGGGAHANSVYWSAHTPGTGGTYSTTYEGYNGNDGGVSYGVVDKTYVPGGQSYYGGEYGRGGWAGNTDASNGNDGYVCIRYVGSVIFSKTSSGSYTFTPDVTGKYEIRLVGAGGGGASSPDYQKYAWKSGNAGGGSGGYVNGVWQLSKDITYSITIGSGGNSSSVTLGTAVAGDGTTSTFAYSSGGATFLLASAGGGTGGYSRWTDGVPSMTAGVGGVNTYSGAETIISSVSGQNGETLNGYTTAFGGASNYLYGGGGNAFSPNGSSDGQDGMIEILYVGSD